MNASRKTRTLLTGLSLLLAGASGCQTWVGGMTLPSPRYLQHPPQYFAPSPAFPLSRELATQEAYEQAATTGAARLPQAVVAPRADLPAMGGPGAAPIPAPPVPMQ